MSALVSLSADDSLVRDFWPVEVVIVGEQPAIVHKLARVWVSQQRVVVVTMQHGKAKVTFDGPRSAPSELLHRNGQQGGRSTITSGDVVLNVAVAHGCGCSSPLRSLALPRAA